LKKKYISNTDKYNWITEKGKKTYIPNTDSTNNMNLKTLEFNKNYKENQKLYDSAEQKNNILTISLTNRIQYVQHDKSKKLSVVIPYRDRAEHLNELLNVLPNVLESQGIEYSINIIEQEHGKPFNRGVLCNIGFLETSTFDYHCFHDVDMVPIDSDYGYSINNNNTLGLATHLARNVEQFDYKQISNTYFGGVLCVDKLAMKLTNGFSNNYWGWGFEDDDLFRRCFNEEKIITLWRNGVYRSMEHSHNYNHDLYEKNKKVYSKYSDNEYDGIKQTKYEVISKNKIDSKTTIITVSV
jgi:sulfur transfer complex TusBCD TusB component (DsrH family)